MKNDKWEKLDKILSTILNVLTIGTLLFATYVVFMIWRFGY